MKMTNTDIHASEGLNHDLHKSSSISSTAVSLSRRPILYGATQNLSIKLKFCLAQNPAALSCEQNFHQVMSIFPDTESVSYDGYFLVFHVRCLPPKPWPQKVAGVWTYITSDRNDFGPIDALTKNIGLNKIACSLGLDARSSPKIFSQNIHRLTAWLNDLEVLATEVQYWNDFIVIVLEDRLQELASLPCSFAQCPCYYLSERDMQMPIIMSLSEIYDTECRAHDSELSAYTWFRALASDSHQRWTQARWVWIGQQDRSNCSRTAPMVGWGLCTSPRSLHGLLND